MNAKKLLALLMSLVLLLGALSIPALAADGEETAAPEAQMEILERALSCFGERICVLHVKDGVFNAEGKWENRPLGQGVMDWPRLLPRLREHNDTLCALREGVFPGMAKEECQIMHRWLGE